MHDSFGHEGYEASVVALCARSNAILLLTSASQQTSRAFAGRTALESKAEKALLRAMRQIAT
jgi:hypothetical protein